MNSVNDESELIRFNHIYKLFFIMIPENLFNIFRIFLQDKLIKLLIKEFLNFNITYVSDFFVKFIIIE